jgi:SanA protein
LKLLLGSALGGLAILYLLNLWVRDRGARHVVPPGQAPAAQVAIVLGAHVSSDGTLSPMLADRVATGVELYRAGKVQKILMSGDHSREDYDEVNPMRRAAEEMGVPPRDVLMDPAGLSTFETFYRARHVFKLDSALVVSQRFHLPRAVYIARSLGLQATGVVADRRPYQGELYYEVRESLARAKDFLQAWMLPPRPPGLGAPGPATREGRFSGS